MRNAALLQLVNAQGVGDATIRRLAAFAAREAAPVAEVLAMRPRELTVALNTTEDVACRIAAARDSAGRLAERLAAMDIGIIWLNDPDYPPQLLGMLGKEAPPILFCQGNANLLNQPAVGFCGSRKSSAQGLSIAAEAAAFLVGEGVCVVSGYANGVDVAAHRAAVANQGTTVLVLAEGILRFQVKAELTGLLTASNHLAISQFPPMLPWMGRSAMRRNATIIGLSRAMILVESGKTGGTFAAGTTCLELGCPLFVVDYAAPGPAAEANPYFIAHGGIPIRRDRHQRPRLAPVLQLVRSGVTVREGPEWGPLFVKQHE